MWSQILILEKSKVNSFNQNDICEHFVWSVNKTLGKSHRSSIFIRAEVSKQRRPTDKTVISILLIDTWRFGLETALVCQGF